VERNTVERERNTVERVILSARAVTGRRSLQKRRWVGREKACERVSKQYWRDF
tara:strand:+ start:938 stop:1096 length:159 start_codon:yes stop_codon:yes gene_type:complete